MKPAVFLDRDGTVIDLVPYLTDPQQVSIVDGGLAALQRLHAKGFALVVVTNQSAIGRGLLDEEGLAEVHQVMNAQLAQGGIRLAGLYHCPLAPTSSDPTIIEHPDRKPGPGMILQAAQQLGIAVGESFMIGDSISDLLAGRHAGCRANLLVRTGHGLRTEEAYADLLSPADHCVDDLASAADLILADL